MTDIETSAHMTSLAWRNRRVIAERTGWPAGAVEVCERLELTYPGIAVSWRHANNSLNPRFTAPAGFYAWWADQQPLIWVPAQQRSVQRSEVYADDAQALSAQLERWGLP